MNERKLKVVWMLLRTKENMLILLMVWMLLGGLLGMYNPQFMPFYQTVGTIMWVFEFIIFALYLLLAKTLNDEERRHHLCKKYGRFRHKRE